MLRRCRHFLLRQPPPHPIQSHDRPSPLSKATTSSETADWMQPGSTAALGPRSRTTLPLRRNPSQRPVSLPGLMAGCRCAQLRRIAPLLIGGPSPFGYGLPCPTRICRCSLRRISAEVVPQPLLPQSPFCDLPPAPALAPAGFRRHRHQPQQHPPGYQATVRQRPPLSFWSRQRH